VDSRPFFAGVGPPRPGFPAEGKRKGSQDSMVPQTIACALRLNPPSLRVSPLQVLLASWREPPVFGGVGGTLPPRLHPGEAERGQQTQIP
jgi:hypothetical protein